MNNGKCLAWVLAGALFWGVCTVSGAEAAGPWKGQIVDAETGQPLEGVVVLAMWYKRHTSPGGWAGGGYYASEEVVTGVEGRFVIQERATWTFNPFSSIKGPEIMIFKPGYGLWRFQGSEAWPKDAYEQGVRAKEAWKQFEGDGAVIALPPLKTREERLKFLSHIYWPPDAPMEKTRRIREAEESERAYLGLR